MVLSGGIENKKAFLVKEKVSNSCGYKRGEIKFFSKLPCVLELPQASLGCSKGSFMSHISCAGREQAWLDASPSRPFPPAEPGHNRDIAALVAAGG